jgi:hypothetical protein
MLCNVCLGVLQRRENLISDNPGNDDLGILCAHHRTTPTLVASAAEGCHICQPFWYQLSESEQEALRFEESKAVAKMTCPQRTEADYFEWLTCMFLRPDKSKPGEYILSLRFSGIRINWGNVSARNSGVAKSMNILKPATSMYYMLGVVPN